MKILRFSLIIVIVLLALLVPSGAAAASVSVKSATVNSASENILVKFNNGATPAEQAQIHRQNGGQVKNTIRELGVQVIAVPVGKAVEKVAAYRANPKVAFAEPDYVAQVDEIPNDPYLGQQWGLTKVEATEAWGVTTGNSTIKIAILDTGVDLDHPDLAGKIAVSTNFTTSASANDVAGHGTHVAGIAAAGTNNGTGTAGLGYDSSIMNVKVMGDDGSGYYSWVAQGIIWAADNGANVINMSLGGSAASTTLESAINYAWSKGVVVVAAAGNNGSSTPSYPAYYSNVIAAAATDSSDRLAYYSNYGDWVDVAAPGSSIYSTLINGSYGYASGTSMSSPFVAGLAGLVFTRVADTNNNKLLNDEVRAQIEATCDDIGITGIGSGRINASRAVQIGDGAPVTGNITGIITDDATGQPVTGAVITGQEFTAFTDNAGSYSISNLAVGEYTLTATATDYTGITRSVSVTEGQTTTANFALVSDAPVTGNIEGKITDVATGQPVFGAVITGQGFTATTDAQGNYNVADLAAGEYVLTVSAADYDGGTRSVSVTEGQTTTADFALEPRPDGNMWVETLGFILNGKNLRLTAVIIGDNGPISGVEVKVRISASDGKVWDFTGVTDSSGLVSFTIRKPTSGTYTATITGITAAGFIWDDSQGVNSTTYLISTAVDVPEKRSR